MSQQVTPFSQLLDVGIYTITMPSSVQASGVTYRFSQWDNGSTSPQRQIDLRNGAASVVAYYMPQQLLSVDAAPVAGVSFTVAKII